ncbi:MAG TPA: TIGR03086 family metal-binding protein [Trebonia sp.]
MLTNSGSALLALDARAVHVSAGLAAQAGAADLARPTPCAGWSLRDLLAHMTAQHYGFAAASAGDGDLAHWRVRAPGEDPVGEYLAAARHVLAAFAADGVLDRAFPLPEFTRGPAFPAPQAVSFHFIDYVVHSWDVAATLGLPARFDPALLDAALRVARDVPAGEARLAPGAAFAPEVTSTGTSGLEQIAAVLGRSPDWKRPGAPA